MAEGALPFVEIKNY